MAGVPDVPDVPLTRQQRVEDIRAMIWEFIADFDHEHGYSPTIRQIADELRIASTGNVHRHLQAMVRKGELLRTPRGYIIPRGVKRPL